MENGHETAFYEPSLVRVEWQDITAGEDTVLADPVTTVVLTNGTDADATLVLRLVGDYGTTRTEYLELGETDVGAGATVVVPVDLSALYAGKTMTYAGRAHVSARVIVEDVDTEHVVGDELFYHRVSEGVALYDEERLIAAHAAGDVSNIDTEQLLSEDPEDHGLVRIVEFEPAQGKAPEEDIGTLSEESVNQQKPPKLVNSGSASAGFQQEVCVRFAVQTVDSGFQSSNGITEDVWPTANNGEEHTANYVRVRVDGKVLTTNSSGSRRSTQRGLARARTCGCGPGPNARTGLTCGFTAPQQTPRRATPASRARGWSRRSTSPRSAVRATSWLATLPRERR